MFGGQCNLGSFAATGPRIWRVWIWGMGKYRSRYVRYKLQDMFIPGCCRQEGFSTSAQSVEEHIPVPPATKEPVRKEEIGMSCMVALVEGRTPQEERAPTQAGAH